MHAMRQMLVPTVDTVRFAALMDACLAVGRSVLLTGAHGGMGELTHDP
jgi:hypothetical protein